MLEKQGLGKKVWAFAGGHIPLCSTGTEPEFTSHDKIAILNTSVQPADVKAVLYYEDDEPVKEFSIKIEAKRIRKIRFNDLIDPFPISLDKPFAFLITSNVAVVVQFSRMDTSSARRAGFCVTAFYKK